MKEPLQTIIDHEVDAAFVCYESIEPGDIASMNRLSPDVIVSFNKDGAVLEIELIAFTADAIATATTYATNHGLAFPANFSALVTAQRATLRTT